MLPAAVLALALAQAAPADLVARGAAELKAGRTEEAERHLAEALRLDPKSVDAYYYLGVLQFLADRLPEALKNLSRAVDLAPARARSWKALGAVHAALGDFKLAEAPFRRACELDPREEAACYYLGRNLYAQNRFEPALEAFRKALAYDAPKNHWMPHRGLGLALEALGRDAEAEAHLREAIRLGPGRWHAEDDPRVDYGVFLFRQGRTREALAPLEAALKDFADSARHRFELGRVLAQLDQLEAAVTHLERAVAVDPRHWAAHLLLGKTYLRLGKVEQAEPHLRIGAKGAAEQEAK